MIYERNGGAIDGYVPEAMQIIRSEEVRFQSLRKKLRLKWVVDSVVSEFDPAQSESLVLLSPFELEEICPGITAPETLSP